MLKIAQLRPELRAGEAQRIFIAGMTGCGKTTLARNLMSNRPFSIAHDWKGTQRLKDWPGYVRCTRLRDVVRKGAQWRKFPRILYAPNKDELNDDYYEAFFQWCFQRAPENGKFVQSVYVDEVTALTRNNDIPDWYKALLTRGRDRGIEVISSSQRPTGIPQWILSEAEYQFVFRLQMKQDRIKMGETISLVSENDEWELSSRALDRERDRILKTLPKRHFFYWNIDMDAPVGPLTLKLEATSADKRGEAAKAA
jgi:energy-coupling factor transporter ATP-binding protein EcfA2